MTQPAAGEIRGHGSKTVARSAGTLSMPVVRDRRARMAGERLLGANSSGSATHLTMTPAQRPRAAGDAH